MADLARGAKGSKLIELQRRLNEQGAKPKLKVDSVFGPKTEAALKGFQKKAKVGKKAGVACAKTLVALDSPKNVKWTLADFVKLQKQYDRDRERCRVGTVNCLDEAENVDDPEIQKARKRLDRLESKANAEHLGMALTLASGAKRQREHKAAANGLEASAALLFAQTETDRWEEMVEAWQKTETDAATLVSDINGMISDRE
ncbi:MAG: peptidoglycan-binding protein [Pseudomonadota bacterium]